MESTAPKSALPAWATADAYLFDIDGTLLNSRDGVHYFAFRNTLRHFFDIDGTIDGVPVHGNTDLGILRAVLRREGIADGNFEAKLPALIRHMCDEVQRNASGIRVELCPSVQELLENAKVTGAASLCSEGGTDLRLWPHRHSTDGFYAAAWEKVQT